MLAECRAKKQSECLETTVQAFDMAQQGLFSYHFKTKFNVLNDLKNLPEKASTLNHYLLTIRLISFLVV